MFFCHTLMLSPAYPFGVFNCENWLSLFFLVFLSINFNRISSASWSLHNLVVPVVMFRNYYLISCLSIHKILSDAYFLVPWSFSMTHGHPSGMESLDMCYQCTMTFLHTVCWLFLYLGSNAKQAEKEWIGGLSCAWTRTLDPMIRSKSSALH